MAKQADSEPDRILCKTEERPIGVSVPVLVSQRLDALVKRAEGAGHRAYRKDIVAALVLAAPEDPAELAKLVTEYRTAKPEAAQVEGEPRAAVHQLRSKPGRRPRTA
jgi:hypothetical protein